MDKRAEVMAAHERFYAAFEALDYDRMAAAWAQRETDVCTHPGWEALFGWEEIRQSWRAIFANTPYMRFEATDVRLEIWEDVARVSCVENIFQVFEGANLHSRVACTNLFVRTEAGWRITLHHGSPIATAQQLTQPEEDEPLN